MSGKERICSLHFVWGTSGSKAGLKPGWSVSAFPSWGISGGKPIATSFLIPDAIIQQTKAAYIKKPADFMNRWTIEFRLHMKYIKHYRK